jgi:hypothetical protein
MLVLPIVGNNEVFVCAFSGITLHHFIKKSIWLLSSYMHKEDQGDDIPPEEHG